MSEFVVRVEPGQAKWTSREDFGRVVRYIDESGLAVEADARVSEAHTICGPEGTVFSQFVVSAEAEAKAEAVRRDAFHAALALSKQRASCRSRV